MDFAVVPTLRFKPLYVLLIISHGRRKIEHFVVTDHPNAPWLIQQITSHSPWQNGICERLIGIVRRELLDHCIPLNQRHLERLLTEYVEYYNNVRTHQALGGETPIVKFTPPPLTLVKDTKLTARPILGGLYHDYEKAA